MLKRIITTICLILSASIISYSQKIRLVAGEYTYIVPETETFVEAKEKAINRARTQALADAFGTTLDLSSTTSISADGAKTFALSESSVKGEWIETIGEPEIERLIDNNGVMAIRVSIKGKARPIVSSSHEFEAITLKNGTDKRFASTAFNDGDDLYVAFKSSDNGYLAIYLYDGESTVYRLLPYRSQNDGAFTVMGGKDYLLFSADAKESGIIARDIDEYTLNCTGPLEINRLFVIFSPTSFSKALDQKVSESLPRELSIGDFQKWLSKIRSHDTRINLQTIDVSITKQ